MTKSPLQFAKDFARFQSQIASLSEGDAQLLLALDFWREMRGCRDDAAYRSYFDEYLPLLQSLITPHNLIDLAINELERLRDTIAEIDGEKTQVVALELAKKYFYVGAIERGLEKLLPSPLTPLPPGEGLDVGQNRLGFDRVDTGEVSSPRRRGSSIGDTDSADPESAGRNPFLPERTTAGNRQEGIPDGSAVGQNRLGFDASDTTNELTALQTLCARANESNHPLADALNAILTEWQSEREAAYHDRARCLFVERDDGGRTVRGRMRTLTGHIELFGKSATTDEITFEGAIKTPDDPFVGVAYDACRAVRAHFGVTGLKHQGSHFYHAHYAIEDTSQTFTGDSIGLAFALLAYVQLLRPEVLRLDRLLSGEVALTGGVDSDGRLTAVNDGTLYQKIERAFFSPVKYLVLPEANATLAREHLNRLRQTYPRRHLHLITAERLSDVIEDHNIVRSEKVCIGEFVAKKAAKYGKMTKVQVPLLAVLAYLLLCLVYPKAWVGFDWRIDHLEVQGRHFRAINPDSHTVWQSGEFATPLDPAPYAAKVSGLARASFASDVNNDGKDELFLLPMYSGDQGNSTDLQFYDSEGNLVWSQPTFVRTSYPGDTASMGYDQDVKYSSGAMIPIQSRRNGSCVLTFSCVSTPYRFQLLLFNEAGRIVTGPYLNTGQFAGENARLMRDINGDGQRELILGGTNNRHGRASLLVIDPTNLLGVSPPYDNDLFLASGMPKGSQLRYVAFPKTELSKGEERKNWVTRVIVSATSPLTYEVGVVEGNGLFANGRILSYSNEGELPSVTYKLDSNFVPYLADFADNDLDQLNNLLKSTGRTPYSDRDSLREALRRDVIVYWGDSIVYHPASGIDFHSR